MHNIHAYTCLYTCLHGVFITWIMHAEMQFKMSKQFVANYHKSFTRSNIFLHIINFKSETCMCYKAHYKVCISS